MFSISRAALRSSRQSAITRPLTTAFSPNTFVSSKSRPSNLSELRSFESLLQRYNSNYGSGYGGGSQGGGYGNQGGEYGGNQGYAPRNNGRGYNNNGGRVGFGERNLTPTKVVYVGNIQFDVREQDLEEAFKGFGNILSTKIIYDAKGMNKGFGYVEFESIEQATKALEACHNTVLRGRRMNVQYVHRPTGPNGNSEPSKTLFIGNLSFDMTDADFDKLFTDIFGCLDVRIAMDRATGHPRGFAHADFVDIDSAVKAKEKLAGVEVFGRRLRIDYSDQRNAGRRDTGNERPMESPPVPQQQETFQRGEDASEGSLSKPGGSY